MAKRRTQKHNTDPSAIANYQYNDKAGAQKQVDVGSRLLPLQVGPTYQTTANAAAVSVGMGKNLALYNTTGAALSVTTGDSTVTSLAIGAVNPVSGKAGIPCKPNDWTYIAMGEDTHVITSAAGLLVYLIDDESFISDTGR